MSRPRTPGPAPDPAETDDQEYLDLELEAERTILADQIILNLMYLRDIQILMAKHPLLSPAAKVETVQKFEHIAAELDELLTRWDKTEPPPPSN